MKKRVQKLFLSKETLRNLSADQLTEAAGASIFCPTDESTTWSYRPCPSRHNSDCWDCRPLEV